MAINGIEMITDRSLSDVEIAKSLIKKGFQNMTNEEKQSFLSGLKGAYNYTDVNRVESAVEYLAERLVKTPEELREFSENSGVYWYENFFDVEYSPEDYKGIEAKNDWKLNDEFTEEERQKYLQKILYVLGALDAVPSEFPQTLKGLTHSGANTIEKSLVDFDNSLKGLQKAKETLITGTAKSWYYSGDLYGGEV